MAGFDKYLLMQKLISEGWERASKENQCDSLGNYCLIPPDSLWEKKPKSFYVYDAETLQEILGE